MSLLEVRGLSVAAGEREILHEVSIEVEAGETVVLLGQNGAGKSTLGAAVMGAPGLAVRAGKVKFEGKDITELSADKRVQRGIFMAMQSPVEIAGVSLRELLRTAQAEIARSGTRRLGPSSRASRAPASLCSRVPRGERQRPPRGPADQLQLVPYLKSLQLSPFMLTRDLNVGCSGGEKKKLEILQLMALRPKLAILDETDSGLDVDAARTVSAAVAKYQQETGLALLIITHNARILQKLKVDKAYVLADGRVVQEGDGKLVKEVESKGFKAYKGA